ncbi:MAG TPA: heterodisulfide reductase-related iron-sulfur binding cluster [Gemmatimonadaceae bacterium]|nr:heterodisulfide reductase-related iron-sulfur binding cluster [Gemmatimonadaceae bacterium]
MNGAPVGAAVAAPETEPARACALPGTPLAQAARGLDACVHCGFCLQACPTYVTLEDENDSPRGRLVLMRALLEGTLAPADPTVQTHLDRCLGCRACETACPSGVPYGQLLEATRATLLPTRPMPLVARLILAVFARPRLLALALFGARLFRASGLARLGARLPGRLGFPMAMLASTRRAAPPADYTRGGAPERSPASAPVHRGATAVLRGCVMEGLFTDANRATERVLRVNGYEPVDAPGQRCCGALHAHAGDLETARRLARANVAAFEQALERGGARTIAVNSAGCGAMMKEYGHLLADDPAWAERAQRVSARVRDVSELLAEAGPLPGGQLPVTVTYDAPCHLVHAQRVTTPPLQVLGAIPGLTLVPLVDSDMCCGSAGIYNLIEPETSDAVLEPKMGHIAATGARIVASGNPGCLMQLGAGLVRSGSQSRAMHPVELLDQSYARAAAGDA